MILLTNTTTFVDEEFRIFDSLEVILITDEDEEQQIAWSLLESTEDFTVFKLSFTDPNSMS